MELETSTEVHCPFCGQIFSTTVDLSGGDAEYIEDCQVCCRPIQFSLTVENLEEGRFELTVEPS